MTPVERVPIPAVGAVVIHQSRVLLVKRGHPPNQGLWTIPGGKLCWGESLAKAAEREVREETGLEIRAGERVHVVEYIDMHAGFHYIIVDLLAQYISGVAQPMDDIDAVAWFDQGALAGTDVEENTRTLLLRLVREGRVTLI